MVQPVECHDSLAVAMGTAGATSSRGNLGNMRYNVHTMSAEGPSQTDNETLIHKVHGAAENGHLTPELLAHVRESVDHSEVARMYAQYEHGGCPNLDSIQSGCSALASILEQELTHETNEQERAELERKIKYLEGRRKQLSYAVGVYADSLAQMWHTKKHRYTMGDEKFRDAIVTIDARRRRQHDALMDSLRGYLEVVQTLTKQGYVDPGDIDEWGGWGTDLSKQTLPAAKLNASRGRVVVFSQDVLTHQRREEIQHWAVAADLAENLRLMQTAVDAEYKGAEE
jgi:hypothetical protein